MKARFYKVYALTNMHVGSGDINYNVIDNEVEKDPVTGVPMIHASGVKGALRDLFEERNIARTNEIFGKPLSSGNTNVDGSGTHRFFDAYMISRPMRATGGAKPFVNVISIDALNHFIELNNAFNGPFAGKAPINAAGIPFGENEFLVTDKSYTVEGEKTGEMPVDVKNALKAFDALTGGEPFAVAKTFGHYDLPVAARNCLKGIGNLWYEEVVPYGSVFYMVIASTDEVCEIPKTGDRTIVQFGGNSSIGRGFTEITALN